MNIFTAEQELVDACRVIFGSELAVSREFLEYLQPAGVKSAYRKRAFETHPDTAAVRGSNGPGDEAAMFLAIQEAYERLSGFLQARDRKGGRSFSFVAAADCRAGSDRRPAWAESKATTATVEHEVGCGKEKLYRGYLPGRPLRFGHFLYYAGEVSFRSIVQALVWQRAMRPRIGELACRNGMLSDEEVRIILQRRLQRRQGLQRFGRVAVSMGSLTDEQLERLLMLQKVLQPRFGEFFVRHDLLSREQLGRLLLRFYAHNAACRPGAFRVAP